MLSLNYYFENILHKLIIILFKTFTVHLHACTAWLLGDGTSALPDGVSVNGSSLSIVAVQRIHSNTYLCTVANIIRQREVAANILVFGKY